EHGAMHGYPMPMRPIQDTHTLTNDNFGVNLVYYGSDPSLYTWRSAASSFGTTPVHSTFTDAHCIEGSSCDMLREGVTTEKDTDPRTSNAETQPRSVPSGVVALSTISESLRTMAGDA